MSVLRSVCDACGVPSLELHELPNGPDIAWAVCPVCLAADDAGCADTDEPVPASLQAACGTVAALPARSGAPRAGKGVASSTALAGRQRADRPLPVDVCEGARGIAVGWDLGVVGVTRRKT